jgi:Fe2+ or Zn2+ uptake regulation protein
VTRDDGYRPIVVHEDLHERASTHVTRDGQRYTAVRRALVEALAHADGPVTVDAIREVTPSIPLSSTYRNLAVLERVGVVEKVHTADDHTRFELAQALTHHHHHHLVCTSCGAVEDFTLPDGAEGSLISGLAEVAHDRGFEATDHRLDLVGLCPSCI